MESHVRVHIYIESSIHAAFKLLTEQTAAKRCGYFYTPNTDARTISQTHPKLAMADTQGGRGYHKYNVYLSGACSRWQ